MWIIGWYYLVLSDAHILSTESLVLASQINFLLSLVQSGDLGPGFKSFWVMSSLAIRKKERKQNEHQF